MKVCAERGEGNGDASLRAHSESMERSLEWIGDEGASQAGDLFRSLTRSLSLPYFLSLCVSLSLWLLQCGGVCEPIIEAVKPSRSLVWVSNEVPIIKAL